MRHETARRQTFYPKSLENMGGGKQIREKRGDPCLIKRHHRKAVCPAILIVRHDAFSRGLLSFLHASHRREGQMAIIGAP